MKTSGSRDFNLNRNEIFEMALREAGILGVGQTPSNYQIDVCSKKLNMMLGLWQQKKINVALVRDIVIFPRYGIGNYPLGENGYDATDYYFQTTLDGDHSEGDTALSLASNLSDDDGICNAQRLAGAINLYLNGAYCSGGVAVLPIASKLSFYSSETESSVVFSITGTDANGDAETDTVTVSTAETYVSSTNSFKTVTQISCSAATAGNIKVGAQGIATGDYIVIQMDDGTTHRDIISSASINLTGCVISKSTAYQGLPSDASDGNAVFVYRSKITKPLDILSARLFSLSSQESELAKLRSREEYFCIPNKTTSGTPTCFWYDPGADVGTLRVWPVPSLVTDVIKAQARIPIDDMDNSSDYAYFPKECAYAIVSNLALRICPDFSKSPSAQLIAEARETFLAMIGSEASSDVMQLRPSISR